LDALGAFRVVTSMASEDIGKKNQPPSSE